MSAGDKQMSEHQCPRCETKNTPGLTFVIHGVYMWSNQHGYKRRIFCHKCGCVWEVTKAPNREKSEIIGDWATKVVNLP